MTTFAVVSVAAFCLFILSYLRRSVLPPRYVASWLLLGLFLLTVALLPEAYVWLSHATFGFADTTNFIFICLILFLLVYNLVLTLHFIRVSDQVQILISKVAIMESDLATMIRQDHAD